MNLRWILLPIKRRKGKQPKVQKPVNQKLKRAKAIARRKKLHET